MTDLGTEFVLHDGTRLVVRAVAPSDRRLFQDAMHAASSETLRLRFGGIKHTLSQRELDYLTNVDGADHYAVGAVERDAAGHEIPAGVARYVRLQDRSDVAEVAVAVDDRFQGKGLGEHLVRSVARVARAHGIRRLEFYVLPENVRMRNLLTRLAVRLASRMDRPYIVYSVEA